MSDDSKVNILLVDDQEAKLRSYEAMLSDLGENLISASSGREARQHLLKSDIAVVLMDVDMPELHGFDLAEIIHRQPHCQKPAIIFVAAIYSADLHRLNGYDYGAVDYIWLPIIPQILRAKVSAFVELYRKSRQLEQLNRELEQRVAERTAELQASTARLAENEERYRRLVHPLPAAIYTCDAQGRVTLYNEAAAALWGREPEIGKDLWCGSWRIYTPEGEPAPLEACPMAIAIREGRPVRGQEIVVERPDGSRLYVLPYPDPIRDASGTVIGAVNMLVDLTERRRAEERMARLQAVTAALSAALTPVQVYEVIVQEAVSALDAKTGMLCIVSEDGQWLELARMTGYGDEVLESGLRFLLTAAFPAAEAARTGEAVWLESPQTHDPFHSLLSDQDGIAGYQAAVSLPLWFEGRALGSLNFNFTTSRALDPEEREFLLTLARLCAQALERARLYQAAQQLNAELEQRVAERTAELERSLQDLNEFTKVASHDLKAPLRNLDSLAGWIARDASDLLPAASKIHLAKLQVRIKRMERLLDDLLTYFRMGRYDDQNLEAVDTGALVRELIDLLAPPPGFTLTVQENMPTLMTHRVLLNLIFQNLIENAIKYHHRADGRVMITAREWGEFVEFSVKDDGPGIDESFHERIFQVFQTLQPRDKSAGTGVGLAIVKKAVENQGGAISLTSARGQGATFRFTWPKS